MSSTEDQHKLEIKVIKRDDSEDKDKLRIYDEDHTLTKIQLSVISIIIFVCILYIIMKFIDFCKAM